MNSGANTIQSSDRSLRTAAIVAGLGLLAMAILGGFANFSVIQNLVIPGDATTTAENIIASVPTFRTGVLFFLVVAILDVVVAWALYILFIPANKNLSLLAAWFRIVYAAILASVLNDLTSALHLLTGSDSITIIETGQLQAQAMLHLSAFTDGWGIGLVIFGLHLIVLGYLAFKSGYFPKWLGVLLAIAGLGYLVDSIGRLLIPDYNISIALFTFLGEVLLMLWLFWKGIKGFDK